MDRKYGVRYGVVVNRYLPRYLRCQLCVPGCNSEIIMHAVNR